jgi:alpha-galactosidase
VDYLKYDNCNSEGLDELTRYPPMRDALNATGHPLFFSLCEWGYEGVPTWGRAVGNSWRTTGDISDTWESMLTILYQNDLAAAAAGPGGWNDPDMLEVGNGGMTTAEYRSHFSLWSLMKAPLIIGCDVTDMDEPTRTILLNAEVIAINQDSLGVQGRLIRQPTTSTDIWAGPLVDGNVAAVLFNTGSQAASITVEWTDLNLLSDVQASLRDLWAHKDLGIYTGYFTATVQPHDVLVLRVIPEYAINFEL